MITSNDPDLTDPQIWDLLERNHVPDEQTTVRVDGKTFSVIVCEKDGLAWPCPTRQRLNATDQPSYRR